VALECGDDLGGGRVVDMRDIGRIAEACERALQVGHLGATIVGLERRVRADRHRLDPATDAGGGKAPPGKFLARVLLALGRDIRVSEHAGGGNRMARQDVTTECDHGFDLQVGKVAVAEVVPRIDDLDADGVRVDVGHAVPRSQAGMPGAPRLRHELVDTTVLVDEIVRGDLHDRIAQPRAGGLARLHAGIVQQQHVDRALALVVIGRGDDARRREIRGEGHVCSGICAIMRDRSARRD
jgi:hypothetical protein